MSSLVFISITTLFFLLRLGTGVFSEDYLGQVNSSITETFLSAFTRMTPGYRPISHFIADISRLKVGEASINPSDLWPWLLWSCMLCGVVGVLQFRLARKIVATPFALLSAYLLVLSVPFYSPSWIFIGGIQSLLYIWMLMGLLAYLNKSSRSALILILVTGPWVREYFIVVPATILAWEVLKKRYFTFETAAAAVGLLHCIFPMWLEAFLFSRLSDIKPIWSLGSLNSIMGSPSSFSLKFASASLPTLIGFMPSFFILGFAGLALFKKTGRLPWLAAFFIFLIPAARYYVMPLYFGYCLIPGSILMVMGLSAILDKLKTSPVALKFVFSLWIALAATDVIQSFFGVARINRQIYQAAKDMGAWVQKTFPEGSPILMNSWLCWDVESLLKKQYPFYFVTHQANRQGNSPRSASTYAELEEILKKQKPLGFIADEYPEMDALRKHKFISSIDTEKPEKIAEVSVKFMRLDPLRLVIKKLRNHSPWIGVPDFILDFSVQPGLMYGVSAEFYGYKVTGKTVRKQTPEL